MASMRQIRPGVWRFRAYAGYLDGKPIQRTRTFHGNAVQARKAKGAFQAESDGRKAPKAEAGTIGDLLELYFEKHAWKSAGGKRKAREDLDTYLIPALGAIRAIRLDEAPIEALYGSLQATGDACRTASGKPMADSTLRRLHTTLRAALNWAVKRGKLGWNPTSLVEIPLEAAPDVKIPDPEEVLLICAEATGEFGAFVRVAVATGRRRQDVLGLRLGDLKRQEPSLVFDERITLQETGAGLTPAQNRILAVLAEDPVTSTSGQAATVLAARTGHATVVSLTRALHRLEARELVSRTTRARRTYRIEIAEEGLAALAAEPAATSGVLAERLDKNQRSTRVGVDRGTMDAIDAHVDFLVARAAAAGTQLRRDAFIFTDAFDGATPWRPDSTSRKFARHMERLRFEYTLHSLRHFHITELLSAGKDVETVAARVGDDPRTIYKVYSHWRRTADQRAAAQMDEFFAQGPARPGLRVVAGSGE